MKTIIEATIRDTLFRLRADWSAGTSPIEVEVCGAEWEEECDSVRDYASPIEALASAVHAHFDDWTADDLSTAAILRAATFDGVSVLAPDVPAAAFGRRAYGASDIVCSAPVGSEGGDLPGWWLHMVETAACGEPKCEHLAEIYRAAVARIVGHDRAAEIVGAVGS
jgi:hypothetical protein